MSLAFVTCPRCGRVLVNDLTPHTDWRGQSCTPDAHYADWLTRHGPNGRLTRPTSTPTPERDPS